MKYFYIKTFFQLRQYIGIVHAAAFFSISITFTLYFFQNYIDMDWMGSFEPPPII